MNYYVVLSVNGSEELEHFTEEKWNVSKERISPERILYVTCDIEDERISDFETIIYDRIFNPFQKNYQKIKVPFSDNILEMEKAADLLIQEKYIQIAKIEKEMKDVRERRISRKVMQNMENGNYDRLRENQELMNKKIPMDMNEFDALSEWKKLSFVKPAGKRIEEIKKSYQMSWTAFTRFVDVNF